MWIITWMVGIDFLLLGLLIATLLWFVTNKFLNGSRTTQHTVEQSVEWAYCFDVHCNSFVPVLVFNYFLQLVLVSILYENTLVSRFLGNTIYLVSAFFYNYITFLGYSALPFLQNTVLLLYPSGLLVLAYLVSLFGLCISSNVLKWYFG